MQVWSRLSANRATPAITDLGHARRVLGRTEEGLLTTDGYERLGIRYRSEAVDSLLSNMSGTAAMRSQRKDGSWTVRIKARISPGNLSSVQIYDTLLDEWVEAALYAARIHAPPLGMGAPRVRPHGEEAQRGLQ